MTLTPNQIVEMIKKHIPDAEIEIEDLREIRIHYHAKIKSKDFKGLSKIKQHQLHIKLWEITWVPLACTCVTGIIEI